jgi:two-component system, NtrC family, sensor histidine kinase HydH
VTRDLSDVELTPELTQVMEQTARRAIESTDERIVASRPLPATYARAFRVHALRLQQTPAVKGGGAIAVLIDVNDLMASVLPLPPDPQTQLLVLGSAGLPIPLSSPSLIAAVDRIDAGAGEPLALAAILDRMRAGETGTDHIEAAAATALGFEQAEVVAAFTAIPRPAGTHWAVAVFASTSLIQAHERALTTRFVSTSAVVLVVLILFSAHAVATSRRHAALRERLRNAAEIAHANARAGMFLDSIPTGVLVLSSDGRVTHVNEAIRHRLPALPPDANLAAAFPDAAAPDIQQLQKIVEQTVTSGCPTSLLGERLTLFETEGSYSVHAIPLDPASDEERTLLVLEDQTEMRELEARLVHADKLATVGVLAASIAHEVGTPLGVVRGRAEYISSKLGADHPQTAGLTVIIEQIDRIARTIQTLLDYARMKPPNVGPTSLSTAAHKVVDLLRLELTRRQLAVVLVVNDNLPPLRADVDHLQQVLVNLLMNAFDACRPGGRLTLVATDERAPLAPPWEHLRIMLSDDGCGIPKEEQRRVFDPFFTRKKHGQGTGLGLAIVSQIVRNHGAQIEIDSEPGRGTRVTLVWPTTARHQEAAHDA